MLPLWKRGKNFFFKISLSEGGVLGPVKWISNRDLVLPIYIYVVITKIRMIIVKLIYIYNKKLNIKLIILRCFSFWYLFKNIFFIFLIINFKIFFSKINHTSKSMIYFWILINHWIFNINKNWSHCNCWKYKTN